MKQIRLHGELAEKYGESHRFAVKSAAEAVRALCANFRGFEQDLLQSEKRNVGYHVIVDNETIDQKELLNPVSAAIDFVPVIMGAGGAVGKIIFGAVLIAAGAAITYFSGGSLAGLGGFLMKAGAGFVLAGIYQAISPVPKAPEPPERPDNKPSYVFNGPVNTTAQGQPVPIGYGRLIVGGAVVSASISVDSLVPITDLPVGGVVYQN